MNTTKKLNLVSTILHVINHSISIGRFNTPIFPKWCKVYHLKIKYLIGNSYLPSPSG